MTESVISITGKYTALRPFLPKDINNVFQWRSHSEDLHLWFQRPEILSFDEFQDDFASFVRNRTHLLMMVTRKNASNPIGMVYSYNSDYLNGHAYLCTFIDIENRQHVFGAESTILFMDYLFSFFPFRKLYAEIYEYNIHSLRNAERAGFVQEGKLVQHRLYGNAFHDMLIMTLYREKFYKRFENLLLAIKSKK